MKNNTARYRLALSLLLVMALITLSLLSSSPAGSSRSLAALWNLGHIPLFFLITTICLSTYSPLSQRSLLTQSLGVLLVTLLLGAAIEFIQAATGRSMDIKDMLRNVLGAILGLAFFGNSQHGKWLKIASLALLLIATPTLFKALIDEYRARQDWPLLADFETELELSRWSITGHTQIQRSQQYAQRGVYALQVSFGLSEFEGISLEYFPSDWSAYKTLQLQVFNPAADSVELSCRIHDFQHTRSGRRYRDRYNHRFTLYSGANRIKIHLHRVAQAPQNRTMALNQIANFQCFVRQPSKALVLYFDELILK